MSTKFQKEGGDNTKKREYVLRVLLFIAIILFLLLEIIVEIKKSNSITIPKYEGVLKHEYMKER